MELGTLLIGVVIVVVAVLLLVRGKQTTYKSHVAQLVPANDKRRQLTIGTWTREEVATHCTAEDAWIIVQDRTDDIFKVYDVTDYVDEHPGGSAILYNAGGDATKGFHGPQHPETVFEMLREFYIGTLADP